jgi:esterase/lipase
VSIVQFLAIAIVVVIVLWLLTPTRLQNTPSVSVDIDLAELLDDTETGIVPGTEKRLMWFDTEQQTEWAVVALHGFSATRRETAPLAEMVAQDLGANLFEARLAGHGRKTNALQDVTAEDWLRDAAEALAIGARIGKKTIVIGTSTGATLATAMIDHPGMQTVNTLIMISPNFAPRDESAVWLTRPAGPLLTRLFIGKTVSWSPENEAQALFWSTSYPTAALVEMMRLVNFANAKLPVSTTQRLLLIYSADDQVVSPAAMTRAYDQFESPRKAIVKIADPEDPNRHVIAGDILSPGMTAPMAKKIVRFVLAVGND